MQFDHQDRGSLLELLLRITTLNPLSAKQFTASIAPEYACFPSCSTPNWSRRIPCSGTTRSQDESDQTRRTELRVQALHLVL